MVWLKYISKTVKILPCIKKGKYVMIKNVNNIEKWLVSDIINYFDILIVLEKIWREYEEL